MNKLEYRNYLKSEHWQKFRKMVKENLEHKCMDCGVVSDQLDVHHLNYNNLWNESLNDVILVCRKCHERRHKKARMRFVKMNTSRLKPFKEKISSRIVHYKDRYRYVRSFKGLDPEYSSFYLYGIFCKLSKMTARYINLIVILKRGRLEPANQQDLIEYFGISKGTMDKFMKESYAGGYIRRVNVSGLKGYVINPAFAYDGHGVDAILYSIFKDDKNFMKDISSSEIDRFELIERNREK